MKVGQNVLTAGGQRGKILDRQKFEAEVIGRGDETVEHADQILVEWTDDAGNAAQNWFEESALTAL